MSYKAQEEWKIDLKKYKEAAPILRKNLTSCYSVIRGQMRNALQNKVRAEKDFDIIESSANTCVLLSVVTIVCNKVPAIDHLPTKMAKSPALMMKSTGNKLWHSLSSMMVSTKDTKPGKWLGCRLIQRHSKTTCC